MRIDRVFAREVLDSRGRPTVEVEVSFGGRTGRSIVPSGASTGQFEAWELRDTDDSWYAGTSVRTAVKNVNEILGPALIGLNAADQQAIDRRLIELDGTRNKSRLGANAVLGVSLATAYAAAAGQQIRVDQHLHQVWRDVSRTQTGQDAGPPSIPLPMVNMISGGLHAGGNLDFQDFLAIPVGAPSYRIALEWIVRIYRQLGKLLNQAGFEGTLVGDEGGYGPKLTSPHAAAEFVVQAIEAAGLQPGRDVCLGLDVASTHFYEQGVYRLVATQGQELTSLQMVDLLEDLVNQFPIISIEDGIADADWEGWRLLTDRLQSRVQLIGDDLFVTNRARLQTGIENNVANSVLVKVNQIGTLTETMETIRLALDNNYWPVISARSGETEDATIADLAVATGAGQIKIGSVARSERLAKYNQLLRLEEQLGDNANYQGGQIFARLQRNV
ncbi:MAG: phosphopyruvate hydratase [Planctomycetota bacterium]